MSKLGQIMKMGINFLNIFKVSRFIEAWFLYTCAQGGNAYENEQSILACVVFHCSKSLGPCATVC